MHKVGDILLLRRRVTIRLHPTDDPQSVSSHGQNELEQLDGLAAVLRDSHKHAEASALSGALERFNESTQYGGLGLASRTTFTEHERSEMLFLIEATMEAINSDEKSRRLPDTVAGRAESAKPMTLAQKIFARHTIGGCPKQGIAVADTLRVAVDWIMASELSFKVTGCPFQAASLFHCSTN